MSRVVEPARDVWIVNHYAFAPDRPAGTRHFDLARVLVDRGDRVTIFAAGFSHFSGREERLDRRRLHRVEWFEGVRFVWLRTVPYRGNTWRRQLNMLSFLLLFLLAQGLYRRPDVVVGSTVHPFAAFGGWVASRLRRATFIFEVRDLWPQTLVDLGVMRDNARRVLLLRWLEAFLVRRASTVITLLPGMTDYLAGRRLPASHVVYIPNGVNVERFTIAGRADVPAPAAVHACVDVARQFRAKGRFVIGYVGAFGLVNRADVIVRAAAIAERRAAGRIGVVMVGDGPERDSLIERAGLNAAVAFCPAVPRRFVPTVLRELDAAVVHATRTPVYRYGISFNKLFEYMAAARPVVFACDSAYDPVRSTGAGITVEPDDPQALAAAFLSLADLSPESRAAMGRAGRDYVLREHNVEHLGDALFRLVHGRAASA